MPIVRININITCAVVLLVASLGGCAARLPEPNVADAERAAKVWPGTTVSDLHRGKQQYMQRCSGCHGLIDPHQFQAGRWPVFVKEMSGKLQISSSEVADLTRYLVVASESPSTH
jgi:mono/diheme cytochrome c family protein